MSTIQRDFNWFSLNFKIEFIFPQSKKMCGFFLSGFLSLMGVPSGPVVKNLSAMQETQEVKVQSLSQEESLEKEMATHSTILA